MRKGTRPGVRLQVPIVQFVAVIVLIVLIVPIVREFQERKLFAFISQQLVILHAKIA